MNKTAFETIRKVEQVGMAGFHGSDMQTLNRHIQDLVNAVHELYKEQHELLFICSNYRFDDAVAACRFESRPYVGNLVRIARVHTSMLDTETETLGPVIPEDVAPAMLELLNAKLGFTLETKYVKIKSRQPYRLTSSLNAEQQKLFDEAIYVVEADTFAHSQLWRAHTNGPNSALKWETVSPGYGFQVAEIAERPVSISVNFARIGGKLIVLYYGMSGLVDNDAIWAWFAKHTKAPMTDAENFHLAIDQVREARKKDITAYHYSLFLDDERDPPKDGGPLATARNWIVARSFQEAVETVERNGPPAHIAFDHDLGEGRNGYDFAQWLVEQDQTGQLEIFHPEFTWYVHSQNPVGRVNIDAILKSYIAFKAASRLTNAAMR